MVNIPMWDQCTSGYLLKLKEHLESKGRNRLEDEMLDSVRQELEKREQKQESESE